MSEYYRNEWPAGTGPGTGTGTGGGSWITPGTGTGGGSWITPGTGTGTNGEWDGRGNVDYLKKSKSGYLLKHNNYLLTGTLHCKIAPQLLIWIGTDNRYDHRTCVLAQLSPVRPSRRDDLKNWMAEPPKSILGYRIDWFPGEFVLKLKWQSGHYPHASIGNMRVALFGVDLGQLAIPISSWRNVATINIDEDYQITINGIRGTINGNAQYL